MKKLLSLIAALALCHSAQAWDGALHTAVASVAHDNLTDVARTELAKALGGYSIIYDAQWLDDVAKGKEYAHVRNYHNVPLTAKGKIIAAKKAAQALAAQKAAEEKEKRVQRTLIDIKKKHGKNAIVKGMNLEEGATTMDRNGQIGGHKA